MTEIETLVQRFVSVWNETDPLQRRHLVRTLWCENGRHLMGTQDVRGHEALEHRVAASNQRNVLEKNYIFRPATAIQSLPGVVKFRWDMARGDTNEIVAAGIGFLVLDEDQLIVCDYLFAES